MKVLGLSALLVLVLISSSSGQSKGHAFDRNVADLSVTNLHIRAENINKLLAHIAYKYGVPISLETAVDENLLKSKDLTVQLRNGRLADVLNLVVKEKPSYVWEATRGIVRVFPKEEFRDPFLETLLAARISQFTVGKATAKLNFREALTRRSELKELLGSYGVRTSNEASHRRDIEPFGGDFSLNLENVSVRSILDKVIKDSRTKYWFIYRDGEHREYLIINF
jgi:hypothetical protein